MKHHLTILLISLPLAFSVPNPSLHANANSTIIPRWQKSGHNAGVDITWYGIDNCSGKPNGGPQQIVYGKDTEVNMASYTLSRDLGPNEQLDFSVKIPGSGALFNDNDPQAPKSCGQYVSTANSGGKTKGRCHTLGSAVGCFRLWAH